MRITTTALLTMATCVGLQPSCVATSDGTNSTIEVAIVGAGQVISSDGTFACSSDPSGGNACTTSQFVGWNGAASSSSYDMCAIPATGYTFDSWGFVVSADCPGCSAADPEMGAIEVRGNDANVRIDINPGYDVDESVTATFVASAANGGVPSSGVVGACW